MKAFISELTEKPMLVRNGKDLSDQFDYRYKGADNGSASAYFHQVSPVTVHRRGHHVEARYWCGDADVTGAAAAQVAAQDQNPELAAAPAAEKSDLRT